MITIFHRIGSASILYIICYMLVDLWEKKKISITETISRLIVIVILFLVMLRT